jgi:hypothetical protein
MDSMLTKNVDDSPMDSFVTGLYTQLPENCFNNSEPTISDSLDIGNNTTNPSSRSVLDQSYPSDSLETPQNIHDTNLNVLESLPLLFLDDQFETKQQQLELTQHCEQQTPDFESPGPAKLVKETDCLRPHALLYSRFSNG